MGKEGWHARRQASPSGERLLLGAGELLSTPGRTDKNPDCGNGDDADKNNNNPVRHGRIPS
jgi:hypothetical protein